MSDPYLGIRGATQDDVDEIYRIERACFKDPYPRGLLKAFLYVPGTYLVAEVDGVIVGYIIGILRYETVGHIVSIAVVRESRRHGIGKRLMEDVIGQLRSMGVNLVKLEVRESNQEAISLYERMGFQYEEKMEGYYADGESAISMSLNVK